MLKRQRQATAECRNASERLGCCSCGSHQLRQQFARLFGRSLRLRQVSAGGCNACEADLNVLTTVVFDIGRFGIEFVASPRHADGLLVTGPVTRNLELAVRRTWEAVPEPRVVIAVGACASSGGVVGRGYASAGGVGAVLPVDVFVPGCPPRPEAIIDGVIQLLTHLKEGKLPPKHRALEPGKVPA